MDPKIPMGLDAEVPLADGNEDRRLRDGVGAEVMQLRSIVLAQRPHEPADGDAEAPLMKTHETHNVALGGFGLVSSGSAAGTRINSYVTVLPLASTSGTKKHAAFTSW